MHTHVLVIAGVFMLGASSAEAQWAVENVRGNTAALAIGADGQLEIAVSCEGSDRVVLLAWADSESAFHRRSIEARWDDDSTDRLLLRQESDSTLLGSSRASREVRALITKLRSRNSVQIQATRQLPRGRGERVTDRIDLTGSSRAIQSLPCSAPPRRAEAPRRSPRPRAGGAAGCEITGQVPRSLRAAVCAIATSVHGDPDAYQLTIIVTREVAANITARTLDARQALLLMLDHWVRDHNLSFGTVEVFFGRVHLATVRTRVFGRPTIDFH